MQTTASPATQGLKRFNIRVRTGCETALQTCLAANASQAWDIAFSLAERLLGATPERHGISVRAAA